MMGIHAFHGADGKVGTTMIAQSVAEYIASNHKELKVIMVSMHGRSGTEYTDRVGESIEGIKLHLDNRLLNAEKLAEECRISENFYILGGVESIEQVRCFHPGMAVYLLESLEKIFDLILVDTGNDIDNGLAIGALEYIENRSCIITPQESVLSRFEFLKPVYVKLDVSFSSFVINKHLASDAYDLRYIEKRLQLENKGLFKISSSGYDRHAESDHKTLLSYKTAEFRKDIHALANHVLTQSHIPFINAGGKKKWIPFT